MRRSLTIITLVAFCAFVAHAVTFRPLGWWPLHDFTKDSELAVSSLWRPEEIFVDSESLFKVGLLGVKSSPIDAWFVSGFLSLGASLFYWDVYFLIPI